MKTKSGTEYIYRQGSARLIDLAERLAPVINAWAEDNLPVGDRLDILLYPADINECPHRMSTTAIAEEKI